MTKKMQHCFYCGEELGVFDLWPGEIEACANTECQRELRYELQAREADARCAAEEDNFDRYR